jgi:hypothetical protein
MAALVENPRKRWNTSPGDLSLRDHDPFQDFHNQTAALRERRPMVYGSGSILRKRRGLVNGPTGVVVCSSRRRDDFSGAAAGRLAHH